MTANDIAENLGLTPRQSKECSESLPAGDAPISDARDILLSDNSEDPRLCRRFNPKLRYHKTRKDSSTLS